MDIITLALAKKFTRDSVAGLWDKWNTSTTYAAGQIVLYNGIPYQKKSGASTPGTFVPAEWERINISDELEKIAGKEEVSNKVAVWSATPVDTKYPSEKLVKDNLDGKQDTSNLVTTWQTTPDDTHYPSEKLVKNTFDELVGSRVYGFHISSTESSPSNAVTYLKDAVGMTPAYMDYTNDVFNYGSWADAFFLPKPCMLKSNGEVDYYLDTTDYTKKADGVTASDVANTSYDGNAMMEWGDGTHLIWMKTVADDSDDYSGSVYIADHKVDEDYTCYPFINSQGNIVKHFYTPIYNGSLVSNKLRSISGQTVCRNKNAQQEIDYAKANYNSADQIWNTEMLCDIQLINALLVLIGKSLDTQSVFGQGNVNNASDESKLLQTGTMNTKGLFWGENTGVYPNGVKVFGMENWWGNQWRRFAGCINDNGNIKVKLTYGRGDGSTADAYNTTGSGYISTGIVPSGSSGGYINKSKFTAFGMIPYNASGSASTYYCDGMWFNNGQVDYAYRGGHCYDGSLCGAFSLALDYAASLAHWHVGAAPSCKPLL